MSICAYNQKRANMKALEPKLLKAEVCEAQLLALPWRSELVDIFGPTGARQEEGEALQGCSEGQSHCQVPWRGPFKQSEKGHPPKKSNPFFASVKRALVGKSFPKRHEAEFGDPRFLNERGVITRARVQGCLCGGKERLNGQLLHVGVQFVREKRAQAPCERLTVFQTRERGLLCWTLRLLLLRTAAVVFPVVLLFACTKFQTQRACVSKGRYPQNGCFFWNFLSPPQTGH